jgi:predicted transcriptional regulator
MFMKYRSRNDIIAQMLQCVSDRDATVTRIMYQSFLSYAQIKQYLHILTEREFVEYNSARRLYKITKKGSQFLELYKNIDELLDVA